MSKEIFVNTGKLRNQADRFLSEKKLAEDLEANIELAKALASSDPLLSFVGLPEKAGSLAVYFRDLSVAANELCDGLEYASETISEEIADNLRSTKGMQIN